MNRSIDGDRWGSMVGFPKVDETIAKNLQDASFASYDNGRELLKDATILYDMERYARAISLAILAEEEFSKAFILYLSSVDRRWDKVLHKALVDHRKKQAISGSLTELMTAFVRHMDFTARSFMSFEFDFEGNVQENADHARKIYIKDGTKDLHKQRAQFVEVDEYGVLTSTPKSFTLKDAAVEIDSALRFGAYVDALYGKRGGDDPLFRGHSRLEYDGVGNVTMYHQSGVTIYLKPFAWIDNGYEADEISMNPHIILQRLDTFDPCKLDEEQRIDLAKIYKVYDFPGQIRAEMRRLGLKGAEFLDEVEGLIRDYGS